MPRQPRYFVAGIPQHVIQRGVDRQAVFFDSSDYRLYLENLEKACCAYECEVHAYVLMTNHTHLLITPVTRRSLPYLMQAMGRTYVQTINRIYQRTGTLWQGRYKASPVQDDEYLLSCYRYIELNPVRAGIVAHPGGYAYSSYAHNVGTGTDPLISEHPVYRRLGRSRRERCLAYSRLFQDTFDANDLQLIRTATNACGVIGNDRFKDQIEAMLGRSVRPGRARRPRKGKD